MSLDLGKAKKILSETFVEDCADLTKERMHELVVEAEMKIKDLKDEKANDDTLNGAKAVVKDLSAGYNSAIKYETAKIQFLIDKIQDES